MKRYLYLFIAIISEVIATSSLKASEGLTKLWPSVLVIAGYGSALYFLSVTVKVMPVGISYAIWSGVGIVLVTLAGIFLYRQVPDLPAVLGMALIMAGVLVIHIFSKTKGLEQ